MGAGFAMLCEACFGSAQAAGGEGALSQVETLIAARRYAQAESILRAYIAEHPQAADAVYRLAYVEQREDRPADSLKTYTSAAQLQKPTSEQLTAVALDYVLLKDYTDAIRWLRAAVEMDGANGDAWYALGRADFTQSRFAEADAAFRKALAIDPKSQKAAENLGLTLDAENRPEEAERFFREGVTLAEEGSGMAEAAHGPQAQATDEWPYLNYANFLLERGRSAEAIPLLRKAAAMAPDCAQCHEKLGRALVAGADGNEGVAELEKAVALAPGEARFHYELGLAYKQAGMTEKAKAEMATSARLYGSKNAGSGDAHR